MRDIALLTFLSLDGVLQGPSSEDEDRLAHLQRYVVSPFRVPGIPRLPDSVPGKGQGVAA